MTRPARADRTVHDRMDRVHIIADDVTGACDAAAELAVAGHRVAVATGAVAGGMRADAVQVVNTQTRMLAAGEAYARVRETLRRRTPGILLKKIDTALRGHLGAELDAVLDGWPGAVAFVLAAIPSAGRVTRGGCQWFGERRLDETEFAVDPEGGGGESSIAAVVARESARPVQLIDGAAVREGALAARVRAARQCGRDVFVVDAETDGDVGRALEAILSTPQPMCLAGSIALMAGFAARRPIPASGVGRGLAAPSRIARPVLVVSGSLHSHARAQCALAAGVKDTVEIEVPVDGSLHEQAAAAAAADAHLRAGWNVILLVPAPRARPACEERRKTQERLAALAGQLVRRAPVGALVLIGGETAYAVLAAVGVGQIAIHGRMAPLIPFGQIANGPCAGLGVVTKGGSGGDVDALARILGAVSALRPPAVPEAR